MTNADIRITLQNIGGRFAQYYTGRHFECIPALFSESGAAYICPDDRVRCAGKEEIADYFQSAEGTFTKESGDGMLILFNNPITRILDDKTAQGCWTAHCYILSHRAQGGMEIEYGIRRYDADFTCEDGQWKIQTLTSFYYSSFEPLPFDPARMTAYREVRALPLPPAGLDAKTDAAVFLSIQQTGGRFFQNRRENAEELFSCVDTVSLSMPFLFSEAFTGRKAVLDAIRRLNEMDRQNKGYPVFLPMLETPVIEQVSTTEADASWHVISHEVNSAAFGHNESYCPVTARVLLLSGHFVLEEGTWKIESLSFREILTLPPFHYDKEGSRMTCMERNPEKWVYLPDTTPFSLDGCEEDMLDIEDIIALWTGSIRHRSFGPLVYSHVAWERPDLIDAPALCREIFGMTDSFYQDQPKYPGFHCGTTPYVHIDRDTKTAVATWFDYGYTSFGEKFGFLKYPWYANPGISRYMIHMVKCDGVWKIYRFNWTPFFRIEYRNDFWKFNYATAKGWTGSDATARFPLPFEAYPYSTGRFTPGDPDFKLDPPRISAPNEVQVGETIGFDLIKHYSGYFSDKPVPRALNRPSEESTTAETKFSGLPAAPAWPLGLTKVADGVYAWITEGYTMMSNAALVIGEECALVFDSLTSKKTADEFYRACREVTDKPLRYLVYSHIHGDHVLGGAAFPEAAKIAHIKDEPYYRAEAAKGTDRWEGKLFSWVDYTGSQIMYPDIFISDDTVIDLGNRKVEIHIAEKCHTRHDLYAVIPDVNVVLMGDLLFADVCPNGLPQGVFNWVNLLSKLADMDATYVPGHGPVSKRDRLLASRRFMQNIIEGYHKMCNGKTLDQAIDELDWTPFLEWMEPGRCYADIDRLYAMMTDTMPGIPINPGKEDYLNTKILKKYHRI